MSSTHSKLLRTGATAMFLALTALLTVFAQQSQTAITLVRPPPANSASAESAVKSTGELLADEQGYRPFGAAKLKEPSAPQTFTLNFHQNTALTSIEAKGDFKVTGGSCAEGRSYSEGDSCTVDMVFIPTGPGHRTGKLVINHTASATPMNVPAGGEGIGAALSFIPATITTVPGAGTNLHGAFEYVPQIAIDGGDSLYIVDGGLSEVFYIDSSGVASVLAGGGLQDSPTYTGPATDAKLESPGGIAVDFGGDVLIGDVVHYVIRQVVASGEISTVVGGGANSGPCTYAAPCNAQMVNLKNFNASLNSYANNLAVDPSGNVFVALANVFNEGEVLGEYGYWNNDKFWILDTYNASATTSNAIAVDANDDVYFADTAPAANGDPAVCTLFGENLAFQDGSPGGRIWPVAGSRNCGFSGDGGRAMGAEISSNIGGFAWDAAGNFYFTDTGNNRVRRVDALTGIIHTIAGNGLESTGAYHGDGGSATLTNVNAPVGIAVDSSGNVFATHALTGANASVRRIGGAGQLSFAAQPPGTKSPAGIILVSNTGNDTLVFSNIAFTSNATGDFTIDSATTNCATAAPLYSGQSCQIGVIFAPLVLGSPSAVLSLTDNTVAVNHTILIKGVANTPPTFSATSLTFQAQSDGTTSLPQSVTLSNPGTLPLTLNTFTLTGKGFNAGTTTCTATLAPLASCTYNFTFSPPVNLSGGFTGLFTLMTTYGGSAFNFPVALSATGTPAPSLLPNPINFTNQPVGSPASQTVTLTNYGLPAITYSTYTLNGSGSAAFTSSTTCSGTLVPGAKCTFKITFSPTAAGAFPVTLSASTSAVTVTDPIVGTAVLTTALQPNSLSFTSQPVGSTVAQSITLLNTGSTPLPYTGYSLSGSGSADYFSWTTCFGTLAPGAGCAFWVSFTPTATGAYPATLEVSTSQATLSATALGTAIAAAPYLSPNPVMMYGLQNAPSTPQNVTLTNPLSTSITVGTASFGNIGAFDPPSYSVLGKTCGATLAAKSSCTFSVQFGSDIQGIYTATFTVVTSSGNATTNVIANNYYQPDLTPNSLTFSTTENVETAPQTVTLTNQLSSAVTIENYNITQNNEGLFNFNSTTCGATLAANTSCNFTIKYGCALPGVSSFPLVVITSSGSAWTMLNGTCAPPPAARQVLSPTSLTFSTLENPESRAPRPITLQNTGGSAQSVTLKNVGESPLTITGYKFGGANGSEFNQAHNCGTKLDPGSQCTIDVIFKPRTSGSKTASLTVSTSAGTATLALKATGR